MGFCPFFYLRGRIGDAYADVKSDGVSIFVLGDYVRSGPGCGLWRCSKNIKEQTFCFMENAENQRVLSSNHGTCLLSIHPT